MTKTDALDVVAVAARAAIRAGFTTTDVVEYAKDAAERERDAMTEETARKTWGGKEAGR
jgi:hypothetical protein